jgi:hypothetical protein
MKKRLLTIAFILVLTLSIALSSASPALAQDYFFSLDKETVDVYWNADGTMSLDYLMTFANQPGGHAIEYIDMGMPNRNFDIGTVNADVNGQRVSVSESDYEGKGSGFAVVLGSSSIQPGRSGTVRVLVGKISSVLHKDSDDENYASGVFAPNYFGSQYVTGNTDITVTFHLPPGVKSEEPRWHSAPSGFPSQPATAFDTNGRVTYTWRNPNASADTEYQFGASFPKSYVPADSIVTVQLPSFSISSDAVFGFLCFSFIGFMFLGMPILGAVSSRRRKMQYLPPKISIEGHGIKRGLTAVEAAILMEQPLDKVMTMLLFGVVKKNAAEVVTRDPLELKVTSPLPDGLHEYELNFLNAFQEKDVKARRNLLQEMTVKLVRSVSEKMKGFSRRETIDYYKSIMEKAWQQVEAADTPEVKSQKFDEALEWTMLDRDYDERTRRVFTRPIFVPMWWGRYDPSWRGSTVTPTSIPGSRGGSTSLPGADFAASVVTGVQTFSSKVIGNVNDFTSRVTNVTNPPPPPPKTGGGSRGGGGRSCACACACAGCACACAGGGR